MKETKIFLTDEEDMKLAIAARKSGQSKVKYCTFVIKNKLRKVL